MSCILCQSADDSHTILIFYYPYSSYKSVAKQSKRKKKKDKKKVQVFIFEPQNVNCLFEEALCKCMM